MKKFLGFAALLALTLIAAGCGGSGSSSGGGSTAQSANVFMTGEDAPLASVVGFTVTLNSVALNGQDGTTAPVISSPVTVDFARLLGLRAPLAFNSVPADTYVSATFVLASPVVDYVTLSPSPAVSTVNGVFPNNQTPYTVTVNFPTPMVVGANGLAGLKMDMDIKDSVATDGNGNLVITNNTIAVNPVIYIKATTATAADGQVTDLMGGLVSVNASANSFVLQGPYGHQLTVDVSSNTLFNPGASINSMATPEFVAVQGTFQADGSLLASGVEVVSTWQSFVSGRVLAISTNSSGQAQSLTMWIGETGADMVSWSDTIQTIDVSQVSNYDICFLSGQAANAIFNNTSVVVGQRVFIGGTYDSSSNSLTAQMLSLRLQGLYGTFNTGSVTVTNGNAGTFTLSNNGLVGYSAGGPVTVVTFNATIFYGLTGLNQLETTSTSIPLVAAGLLLEDPVSKNPFFAAGLVADPPLPSAK